MILNEMRTTDCVTSLSREVQKQHSLSCFSALSSIRVAVYVIFCSIIVPCITHYVAAVVLVLCFSMINTWKAPLTTAVMYSYMIISSLHRQQKACQLRRDLLLF